MGIIGIIHNLPRVGGTIISKSISAQKDIDLSILTLPKEMKEGANLVVRNKETVIDVKSVDQMTIKETYVVTVLNKIGHQRLLTAEGYENVLNKLKKS